MNISFTEPTILNIKMKYILSLLFAVSVLGRTAAAPLEEPMPFEKFFKKTMKITPGLFPVYQDGSKYFLEIPADALNSDILVIGDISRGFANDIAGSSGVIHFSLGSGNNLNVTKEVYKEALSPDFNQGMEGLVQKSNLVPVSFVMHIEASGKSKKSYIIDMTRQLMEGGDLFSFKDFSGLSRPDATRSGIQQVKAAANGVVFTVLRTQTDPGSINNGRKSPDRANAYMLNLVIQRLQPSSMKIREADPRIGFGTVAYNDFGKKPYGVTNVKVIKKWNLQMAAGDEKRYQSGELVNPVKSVKVFIDHTTPALFVPYIKQAVAQWNEAFKTAGFKNALVVVTDETDNWLSFGKIQIKWGNAFNGIQTNLVTDPRTGEILAGKMNINDNIINDLLPSYFAKCGLKDPRIVKDLYDPEVRGEIMRWKVAQTLGELLGMVPNLYGSAAFTPKQLRSGSWLTKNSISSSVTDDMQFNYVLQPEDKVSIADLMPRVSTYDRMAINWAYRAFGNRAAEQKFLSSVDYSDSGLRFLEENKDDPYTRHGDLSSDQIEAAELGMKNIMLFYPQLEKISDKMKGNDEDWSTFKLLSSGFQKGYQLYTDNVGSLIGGQSPRPVRKGYNEVPVVYTSKKDQQKAMELLNTWLFSGVPAWMQSEKMNLLNGESENTKIQHSVQNKLKQFISPQVLSNLVEAEYALGKETYTASDLFSDLDHYVFKDFNAVNPVDAYTMLMQTNFVYDIAEAAAKNNITGGLNDTSEIIHIYFMRTMEHIKELAEKHMDLAAREHYQLMKVKIERDMNQKQS